MSLPAAWPQIRDIFGTPLVIEPSQGQLSSADHDEVTEEIMLDVMDALTGWCHPDARLLPDKVAE